VHQDTATLETERVVRPTDSVSVTDQRTFYRMSPAVSTPQHVPCSITPAYTTCLVGQQGGIRFYRPRYVLPSTVHWDLPDLSTHSGRRLSPLYQVNWTLDARHSVQFHAQSSC